MLINAEHVRQKRPKLKHLLQTNPAGLLFKQRVKRNLAPQEQGYDEERVRNQGIPPPPLPGAKGIQPLAKARAATHEKSYL
ncbi:MAG: hypothetical protein JW764_03345 [Chlorobiaceae bacterium]|nr:hypothetical protein [Chlorobiaceae bacterium]